MASPACVCSNITLFVKIVDIFGQKGQPSNVRIVRLDGHKNWGPYRVVLD